MDGRTFRSRITTARSEEKGERESVRHHSLALHAAIDKKRFRRGVLQGAGSDESVPEESRRRGEEGEDEEGFLEVVAAVGLGEGDDEVSQGRNAQDGAGDDHLSVELVGLLRRRGRRPLAADSGFGGGEST